MRMFGPQPLVGRNVSLLKLERRVFRNVWHRGGLGPWELPDAGSVLASYEA